MEELHPIEIPLAFGVLFFLLFFSFFTLFLFKTQREPLLTPLKRRTIRGGGSRRRVACPGPHSPYLLAWGLMDSGWGGGRPAPPSDYFIILVFNFNHSAHIKERVFENKNKP